MYQIKWVKTESNARVRKEHFITKMSQGEAMMLANVSVPSNRAADTQSKT